MLRLDASVVRTIHAGTLAVYPDEACGLLLGPDFERIVEAPTMVNCADDRRRAYLIDPEDYLRGEYRAEDLGLRVVGVWHSHPNGSAVPSATDLDMAWPDWHYVIIAVGEGHVEDMRAWKLGRNGFEEEVIEQ